MALKLFELLGADDRRFSPYCWRVRMALAHKGLEAEIIPCKFTDKHLFAFSGQDRVPVLQDGNRAIFDSWDIACYLEEAYPDRPTLFGGPIGRAEAKFINAWMPEMQQPMLRIVIKDIYDHTHPDDREYFRATREKRFGAKLEELHARRDSHRDALEKAFAPLRSVLESQPFLCGNAPAYADYIVFGSFQLARSISPYRMVEPGDPLYDWRRRLLNLYDNLARSVPAYSE